TRPFAELAQPALRLARDGFPLTARAANSLARSRALFGGVPFGAGWMEVYGSAAAGERLRQPGLARTIAALATDGPDAYYRGPIGAAVAGRVRSVGGLLAPEDLAGHSGGWVEPLYTRYRGVEVFELPPNTQGVTALEALNIVE